MNQNRARAKVRSREGSLGVLACIFLLSSLNCFAVEPGDPPRVLFLTHAGLYKHQSLGPAEAALKLWGEAEGFEVVTLKGYEQEKEDIDLSMITPEYLAGFDVLMMMTNGNLPMTEAQKRGIVEFVRGGGGFVGVHCASLTFYDYPEFGEMLGGYFRRAIKQNHEFVLKIEDREHPATRMLGAEWPLIDEFYLFGGGVWDAAKPDEYRDELFGHPIPVAFSREHVHVLISVDSERSNLEGVEGLERGGDYPQAWCQEFDKGRSFYTALGHRADMWTSNRQFRAHIVGGIWWVIGSESRQSNGTN